MGKTRTIILDENLDKKIRQVQATLIKKSSKSVSFSYVLNQAVKEGLPKIKN